MEKINYLFDCLSKKLDSSAFELIQQISAIINNPESKLPPKKDAKFIYNEAKQEVLNLVLSKEIENEYLFKYITEKIISIDKRISSKNYKVKDMVNDKELGSLLWEWSEFIKWFENEIIHSKIIEIDDKVVVKTSNDKEFIYHINPECNKKCQGEFITQYEDLCEICPIKNQINEELNNFHEKYFFSSDKEKYLTTKINDAEIKIEHLINEKSKGKGGLNVKNWNFLFLHWILIRNFCQSELQSKSQQKENVDLDLPEIELKTQKDQIRLLYDLGVIQHLQNEYPATLKDNNNQVAHLIAQILKIEKTSIQPTVNALLNDNGNNKNYPKESANTKAIIDKLNANESI